MVLVLKRKMSKSLVEIRKGSAAVFWYAGSQKRTPLIHSLVCGNCEFIAPKGPCSRSCRCNWTLKCLYAICRSKGTTFQVQSKPNIPYPFVCNLISFYLFDLSDLFDPFDPFDPFDLLALLYFFHGHSLCSARLLLFLSHHIYCHIIIIGIFHPRRPQQSEYELEVGWPGRGLCFPLYTKSCQRASFSREEARFAIKCQISASTGISPS